ncbi:MAG: hypothetical protein UT33_C0010G0023 [Candidatus Peregrinibacteria bacterium GW2011_GWC2_39_14]|nr:MAG: hypothetical protein US92_C0006G0023 [Candidatus Peregrinibacteria bacterium GW2011_GWA2_38_36]KKR05880.1 MAG: hypothetical protein UT33_C0010G0023 [Candidatus Peregrinibacteria bacterium GW2011_GWC2_39_14]
MAKSNGGAQARAQNPEVLAEKPSSTQVGLDALKRETEVQSGQKEKDPRKREAEVGIKKGSTLDTSRLAREVERSDLDQAHDLSKIDIMKVPEIKEEKEKVFYLRDVSLLCLSTLLAKGKIRVEQIKDFSNFAKLDLDVLGLNATEKMALKKLQEVAGRKDSPLHNPIAKNWGGFVDGLVVHSKKSAEQAEQIKREASGEKGIIGKTIDYVKENPLQTAMIAAGAGLGLYMLLRKKDPASGKKGKSDKSGKADVDNESGWDSAWKWGKRLLWGAGITWGAARLLEWDTAQKFIKKTLKIDVSNSKWIQAFSLMFGHWEFQKAWDVLHEGQENAKLYDDMIDDIEKEKKIKISRRTLEKISYYKYGKFMQAGIGGIVDEALEWGGDKVDQLPIVSGMLEMSGEERAEAKIVREYLKDHDKDLRANGVTDDMTLMEAFSKLTSVKIETPRALRGDKEYEKVKKSTEAIKDPQKRESVEQMLALAFVGNADYPPVIATEIVRKYIADLDARGIDTKSAKAKLAAREKASDELNKLIAADADEKEIRKKIEEIVDLNDDIVEFVDMRHGWTELKMLLPQGVRTTYRWFRLAPQSREYGKYGAKKLFLDAPRRAAKMAKRIAGRGGMKTAEDFRRAATEIDTRISSGRALPTDVELAGIEAKIPVAIDADKIKLRERFHSGKASIAETDLLKHQSTLHRTRAAVMEAEQALETAVVSKAGADVVSGLKEKIVGLRGELAKGELELVSLNGRYLAAEKDYMTEYMLDKARVGVDGVDSLRSGEIERFNRFEEAASDHVKGILDQVAVKERLAEQLAKAGKKVEAEAVLAEINVLGKAQVDADMMFFERTAEQAKHLKWLENLLKKCLKGPRGKKYAAYVERLEEVMRGQFACRDRFKAYLKKTKSVSALNKFGNKFPRVRMYGGKAAFLTAIIVGGGLLGRDAKTGFLSSAGQTAVDVLPISGEISDIYSVITGKEMITGRSLGWTDRGIRALFGVAGIITDLALILPVLGEGIKGGYMSLKASVLGVRLVASAGKKVVEKGAEKVVERVAAGVAGKVAEEVVENVAERAVAGVAGKVVEKVGAEVAEGVVENVAERAAAGVAGSVAEKVAEKGAEEVAEGVAKKTFAATAAKLVRVGAVLQKVALAGALGAMGYSLLFQSAGEKEIPQEMKDVVGEDAFQDGSAASSEAEPQVSQAA